MSELAEFTQLPPASLTRLSTAWSPTTSCTAPDPRDRRGVLVHLTERGLALNAARRRRHRGGRVLGDVDPSDAQAAAACWTRSSSVLARCADVHPSEIVPRNHLAPGEAVVGEFVQDYEVFDLGDVGLQSGATLRGAKLAYKTYGELNADKSNAIVYPTWYSGFHWDNEWLIGEGMALDPAKYFIVVPNMLGNGLSSRRPTRRRRTTARASRT